MPKEKTNADRLRELLNKVIQPGTEFYEEIDEFIEYMEEEKESLQNEVKALQSENNSLDGQSRDLMLEIEELRHPDFETIDCGIGTIEWRSDNLKLQQLMQDFSEKQESILFR